MFRKLLTIALMGLLVPASLSADEGRSQATTPASRSSGKRVAWTIIGAAAGFGAGMFLGLNAFDDAINSDRKVWTTAIVGAAAGGFAGAFLSRNVGRTPASARAAFAKTRDRVPEISWTSALQKGASPSLAAIAASRSAGLGAENPHDR
jgi:hypothetical protein